MNKLFLFMLLFVFLLAMVFSAFALNNLRIARDIDRDGSMPQEQTSPKIPSPQPTFSGS